MERYQTIYAKEEGAVAAPTAGHFLNIYWKIRNQRNQICWSYITRRFGTFNPVEVEDLSKHKMDSEELKLLKQPVIL
jgi:S-adenosylmethionine:tRNA ribosyltransferase-isomerase